MQSNYINKRNNRSRIIYDIICKEYKKYFFSIKDKEKIKNKLITTKLWIDLLSFLFKS